jgi:hypothetical protein
MVFRVFEGLFTRVHLIKFPFLTLENGFFWAEKRKKGLFGTGKLQDSFSQKGHG